MALFQGTVGKLSPPRIKVDLTQDEEVEMVRGPFEHSGPIFLGGFISDHDWYDQLMSSSLLAPESVDPASEDGEATEYPARMWEVDAGVSSLVEEWERVEKSLISGPWGPEFWIELVLYLDQID